MNNLIFNTVASELKTSIYAYQSSSSSFQPIQLDDNNNILMTGTVAVSGIDGTVTISGIASTVTVAGSVTVSGIDSTVTVGGSVTVSGIDSTVTVAGSVTGTVTVSGIDSTVTVAGSVTVSGIDSTVTVAGTATVSGTVTVSAISSTVTIAGTATVTIGGSAFTTSTTGSTAVTASTLVTGTNKDISPYKEVSYFVYNTNAATVSLTLQFSPTTNDADYINDPSYTNVTIPPTTGKVFMTPTYFSNYVRIIGASGTAAGTVSIYFNAQA